MEAGRVLESTPQALAPDAEGVIRRADLALLVNRPDLAWTFLSEAAARWPRDAAVRLRYGLALIVAGHTPAAIGQLEEAVRLDPGDGRRAPQSRGAVRADRAARQKPQPKRTRRSGCSRTIRRRRDCCGR